MLSDATRMSIVRFLLLVLLWPIAELALLLLIGDRLGVLPTVVLILVTGFLGAYLARRQGAATFRRFREAFRAGRLPGEELVDGVLVLLAAAMLLAPGMLTDVGGAALMIPPVRRPVGRLLVRYLKHRLGRGLKARTGHVPARLDPDAVDVDFRVVPDEGDRRPTARRAELPPAEEEG